jgi:predicted lipoprotein with Yx(FWY)xxD motif
MHIKRTFLFTTIGLLIAMFIAACGSNTSTGGGGYGAGSSSAKPTTAPSSTPTTAGSGNSSVMIKTATATIKGKSQTILTNVDGRTLYYFTPDTATTAACTGSCISMWPPLLSPGSGSPTSASTLSGTLSVQTDANGKQVEYNGHPLYVFSGDTAAGQTNGEGLFGKWFVATPALASQGGGSATPSSTPSGY